MVQSCCGRSACVPVRNDEQEEAVDDYEDGIESARAFEEMAEIISPHAKMDQFRVLFEADLQLKAQKRDKTIRRIMRYLREGVGDKKLDSLPKVWRPATRTRRLELAADGRLVFGDDKVWVVPM